MATMTPLNHSLSTSGPRRDESVLHRGAAVGAVVFALAIVASVVGLYVSSTVGLGGSLTQEDAWAPFRFDAACALVASAAVLVTAVLVHADTRPPRVLSWAALVVAVAVWVSAVPFAWLVAGRFPPFWFPVGTMQIMLLWLCLAGVAALAERTWHWWLGALTVLTGVVAAVGQVLSIVQPEQYLVNVVAVTLWAVVFAVVQVRGPHPPPGTKGAAS